jgi:DNA-binding LacI/PurR family transcriptional regulator
LPDYSIRPSDERFRGFQQHLQDQGISLLDDYVIRASPGEVTSQITRLFNHPDRPTAIFAASDELAMQVLSVAHQEGLSVPKDLALIGFDDLDFASHIGLTTISQQLDESGRIAAELLLNHVKNLEKPKQTIELQLSLIERNTA